VKVPELRSAPVDVDIDVIRDADGWPPEAVLVRICDQAVAAACSQGEVVLADGCELAILFADDERVCDLNSEFRSKDQPTNVLSFPSIGDGVRGEPTHLGDIVLAYETVAREAEESGKPFDHHLAHLVMHGFLHVLGYDHEDEAEARVMEALETRALASLGIADPYADEDEDEP